MDSLTTAYLVSMLIGSVCAIGGALLGNKMAPIESSAAAVPEPVKPVPPPQNTVQTAPATSSVAQ